MREAQSAERPGDVSKQSGLDDVVDDVEELVRRHATQPAEGFGRKVRAQHRSQQEDFAARLVEVVEATTDHVSHPLRHPNPKGERIRQLAQLPFSGKKPDRLADKQGVAVGLLMQRRDQPRRKRQTMGSGNEPGDVGLAQPDEVDPPGRRLPTQLRHRGRHRVVGRQCDIAVRAQNQQPRIPHLASEKLQE